MRIKTLVSLILPLSLLSGIVTAAPLGTAFTYQGKLTDGTNPANGLYDLRFAIYDAAGGSGLVTGPLTDAGSDATDLVFSLWSGAGFYERLRLQSDGNVGIGTSTPSYKLHVNGSVAGVGAYVNLSDARFKKNITPLTNALETVLGLRGVSFEWRAEEHPELDFEPGRQVGLVAQEVAKVLPEAVSQDSEGTCALAYSKVVPVLVEAINEQQAALQTKEAELQALQRRLDGLEQWLSR
jgi:hypothetical protein